MPTHFAEVTATLEVKHPDGECAGAGDPKKVVQARVPFEQRQVKEVVLAAVTKAGEMPTCRFCQTSWVAA